MPVLRMLLVTAAKRIASDPRAQAAAIGAFNRHVRPQALAAWQRGKPRVTAACSAGARTLAETIKRRRKPAP